ncbi:cyclic nucleotide-binding domain-containing protein [Chlamydiota bacterium]
MDQQEKFTLLKANYLFTNLSDDQINQILSIAKEITIPQGDYLMHEGDLGNELFLITKGKVGVFKKEEHTCQSQKITSLEPGEVIGELALIDKSPRSASIVAEQDSKFLLIPITGETPTQILQNLSSQVAQRLRDTNEFTVKALQEKLEAEAVKAEMGNFLFRILVILSGWIIATSFVVKYASLVKNTSFISIPAIFLIFLICVFQVIKSIFPPSDYGLNLRKWGKCTLEAILVSLPILIAGTILKILLVKYVPSFHGKRIIAFDLSVPSAFTTVLLPPLIYVLFTPLQEFLARGTMQTCIKFSLSSPNRVFWSIILSNLCFASFHAFLSPLFAAAAFGGGLLWGWLYARQGSLVGCCVSHALIGGYFLAALGFGAIFIGKLDRI